MPELDLAAFLEKKGEEYAPFDPKRFRNFLDFAKEKLSDISPRVVQIVGTNGKGSTGRFLATMLSGGGFRVGHFTSPHVLNVTERFWLDGKECEYTELLVAHRELSELFGDTLGSLSYFEYLSLLGFYFLGGRSEILILEAGVGGEFDSTNGFAKELLVVTKISKDHTDMLGETLFEIAKTKLAASNCKTVIAKQEFASEVKSAAMALKIAYESAPESVDESETAKIQKYIKDKAFPSYLAENLLTAYVAAKHFLPSPDISSAVPPCYRFFRYKKNIILDVGHNVDAAKAVQKELGDTKITLIFNSYADKNPIESLEILKPSIQNVLILPIEAKRAIKIEILTEILDKIGVSYKEFDGVDDSDHYLVFGSFAVVAEFLRRGF